MSLSEATLGIRMDRITLSVPAQVEFHGTLRLVLGGIGARSRLSYEQVSELQLAVESLVSHRRVLGDRIDVEASVDGTSVSLRIGPFEPGGDSPGARVLERLVDSVAVVENESGEWLELVAGATTTAVGSDA
jgi:hypothetical protein